MSDDISIEVVNVVATCKLPFEVNLESLVKLFPRHVRLNSKYPRYRCAYVKLDGVKGIVTVFSSGVMISVGSRSVEDAKRDSTIAFNAILDGIKRLQERASIDISTKNVKS
jgi:TATA-box binding protein (TBP) (component of TFIID and TFIIIB)